MQKCWLLHRPVKCFIYSCYVLGPVLDKRWKALWNIRQLLGNRWIFHFCFLSRGLLPETLEETDSYRVDCWHVYWTTSSSSVNCDAIKQNKSTHTAVSLWSIYRILHVVSSRLSEWEMLKNRVQQQACVIQLKQKPAPWMFLRCWAWPLTFPWPLISISAKGEEKCIITGRNKD